MAHARSPLLSLVALSLVACGPVAPAEDGASEGDATGTTSTDGDPTDVSTSEAAPTSGETGAPDAGCLEIEYPSTGETRPAWRLGCDGPWLCFDEQPLIVTLLGDDPDGTDRIDIDDLERARCMLTAMAERRPGHFDLALTRGVDVLSISSLEIVGDVAVARTQPGSCTPTPNGCQTHEMLRALRPAAFIRDCMDGDARALYFCLRDALEPVPVCLPGPLECPP